jgi:hypothetical protein
MRIQTVERHARHEGSELLAALLSRGQVDDKNFGVLTKGLERSRPSDARGKLESSLSSRTAAGQVGADRSLLP